MDQLIELLTQIQDLAGSAIEALQGAMSDSGAPAPEAGPPEGGPAGAPPEEPPA